MGCGRNRAAGEADAQQCMGGARIRGSRDLGKIFALHGHCVHIVVKSNPCHL